MGYSHNQQERRGSGDQKNKSSKSKLDDEIVMEACCYKAITVEGCNQSKVWDGREVDNQHGVH